MKRGILRALLLAGCTAGGPARSAGDSVVALEAPRPFGHTIGDVIRHRITLKPKAGDRLDQSSLPQPGALNRWLELRRVELAPAPGGGLRLDLEYQTFYVPLAVKALSVPGFSLRFTGSAGASVVDVPSWPFRMAPLHGLAVLEGEGVEPLRPDAPPEPPDTAGPGTRAFGFLMVALLALGYLGYARGFLDFGRRGRHFRDARRALHRLRGEPENPEVLRAGFTCVHRAFDRTLGAPLFAERLPEFFEAQAPYVGLREDIEDFFRASYGLFFGDGAEAGGYGLDRLEALSLACLRVERNRP